MLATALSLTPLFLIIGAGYVLKHRHFPTDSFWPAADKLTFYVLIPPLLFLRLAQASIENTPFLKMIIASGGTVLVTGILLLLVRTMISRDGPAFTSIFQGSIRSNGVYIGLPSSLIFFGEEGFILATIIIVTALPIVNSLCIISLLRYASHEPVNWITVLKTIIKNPIVISCILGLIANVTHLPIPALFNETLDILARAALTIGLLGVGAGLDVRALKFSKTLIGLSTIIKFLLFPLLAATFCILLGIDNFTTNIVILYACLPTSAVAYVFASQMGGDAKLMAGITVVHTLLATISMPLTVSLARMVFPY